MNYISIDPGEKCGVAIWDDKKLIDHITLNSSQSYFRELAIHGPQDAVIVEDQWLGKNVSSLITLAHEAGRWIEFGRFSDSVVVFISPSRWQSAMLGRGRKRDQLKKLSIERVRAVYEVTVDDHIADAINIGCYWFERRKFEKERGSRNILVRSKGALRIQRKTRVR